MQKNHEQKRKKERKKWFNERKKRPQFEPLKGKHHEAKASTSAKSFNPLSRFANQTGIITEVNRFSLNEEQSRDFIRNNNQKKEPVGYPLKKTPAVESEMSTWKSELGLAGDPAGLLRADWLEGQDSPEGLEQRVLGAGPVNEDLVPVIMEEVSQLHQFLRRKRKCGDKCAVDEDEIQLRAQADQQKDLKELVGTVEDVVSGLLDSSSEAVRKNLGVCRKVVPTNFFNPPLDNTTSAIIKGIIHCVQDRLADGLSCQGCITLHEDLQKFLMWMIRGIPGMPCCPSRKEFPHEKNTFLFGGQVGFSGVTCRTTQRCPIPSPQMTLRSRTACPDKRTEQLRSRVALGPSSLEE